MRHRTDTRTTLMASISSLGVATASASLALGLIALSSGSADARITRIEITKVEKPVFDGTAFGAVGQYEKIVGRAYGEVDPKDPRNAVIVDIANAPKNARGMVEYDTDVFILKPIDLAKGNHRLWFEVNNRGNMPAYESMTEAAVDDNNPTKAADAGNGFLMRQGFTILETGWDISAPKGEGRFTIRVPVAKNPDGSPIVGPSMEEFVVDNATTKRGRLTYPAATLDKSKATLTVRTRYEDAPVTVPADKWQYTDEKGTSISLASDAAFENGKLYTFVYQAKDPLVGGLGFAALRDVGSFLRNAKADDAGTANPLAGGIQYVYTACQSQPCRTLHDYLWLGFNQDETGKKVVDGISNWIGGSTGIFTNFRFGQAGRTQRQHIARWFPEFQGPFTNQVMLDPITGKTDGRLARCTASNTCPKIFETNSANEYWSKNMAVGLVDTKGKDLTNMPDNVRNYFISSMFHGGAFGAKGKGICQQVRSPLTPNAILRALIVDMDEWVTKGTEPPASRVPSASKGTLVSPLPQEKQGFPKLQGVTYNGRMHDGDLFDFGPDFDKGIMTILPPKHVGTPYPALVPKTDADGNDIAGIRMPDVAVPVATYTGWALRANSGDDGCDGAGQMIPFAKTKAERMMNNDPRPSLEERYTSHADYVSKVSAAAANLQQARLLLDEDVQAYAKKAEASPVGK
ncbi:MAG TPA: alpha/beta hydrolase domain-containing protein [Micropepsaceae bacterium]|nr:alpha/beta hydrolase domain-containing protein [Micropepsaceae bacterium]